MHTVCRCKAWQRPTYQPPCPYNQKRRNPLKDSPCDSTPSRDMINDREERTKETVRNVRRSRKCRRFSAFKWKNKDKVRNRVLFPVHNLFENLLGLVSPSSFRSVWCTRRRKGKRVVFMYSWKQMHEKMFVFFDTYQVELYGEWVSESCIFNGIKIFFKVQNL